MHEKACNYYVDSFMLQEEIIALKLPSKNEQSKNPPTKQKNTKKLEDLKPQSLDYFSVLQYESVLQYILEYCHILLSDSLIRKAEVHLSPGEK